jgi:hypothetical protein
VDTSHAYVTERLLGAVQRIDRFFGETRQADHLRNDSWVRWRNDLRLDDHGRISCSTSLGAEIRIPSLDARLHRLRLTIAGSSSQALDKLLPGDPAAPDEKLASLGLKLGLFDGLAASADVSAGILASLPVGWFARLRLRHVTPVGEHFVAKASASGFWHTPTGLGTREDLDLERRLPWRALLRLASTATITEVSRGWEWASELSVSGAWNERTGLFLGGGPSGATALGPSVEIWRVHAKARRDAFRRWIFLEVEPGVEFTRQAGGGRVRDRFVILRLEVQFDAEARRRVDASGG